MTYEPAGRPSSALGASRDAMDPAAAALRPAGDLLDAPSPPPGWLGAQLRRLQRLLDLQRDHAENLNAGGRRLLNHAIFVTYVECMDSGGKDMARDILRGERIQERVSAS